MINKQNLKNFMKLLFWIAVVAGGVYFAWKINAEVNVIKRTLDIISS